MARADETLLLLKFIAEVFDGQAAKFTESPVFPFAPASITEKIVQGRLVAFRFQYCGAFQTMPRRY